MTDLEQKTEDLKERIEKLKEDQQDAHDAGLRSDDLKKRINKLRSETIEKPIEEKKGLTAEKVLAEMIAGLIFGFVCGWYIDEYFDTKPLFLLIMIF